ncbi:MAG TPA: carboxypeptidase-like regulatory domain-containing protein [Patescibacteria group bacterium]|nr:carboxypeptidase-like regulatory domain-containing protein [Patescibacteria group bacterium]
MTKKVEQGFATIAVVMLIIIVVLVAVVGLVLIQKQPAKPSSTANSQIESTTLTGTVTQGPTTPTCSDAQPCDSPVANHTIEALDSSGNVVATAKTNDAGKYSFHLKPGHYVLKLVPQVGSFASGNDEVDVADSPKEFNITIDTGIR